MLSYIKSGSGTSDEPESMITSVGEGKPTHPTLRPDQGSDNGLEMDQGVQPKPELLTIDNINLSVSHDSLSLNR